MIDWLVFCKYGFSVSPLWCPLATPTILLGFLLPWAWVISSRLLQQSAVAAPYLGRGVSPHCRPSWPSSWDSSSRPSCAHTATAPWTWGWSSWLLPLASGLGRGVTPLVATPDLGLGVAPLGHSCAVQPGTLSHCTSPQTWGNSSWPPPLGHGVLPGSAPDLGRGVAPLSRACVLLSKIYTFKNIYV